MIDVSHEINATRRTVGSRTLEAGDARVLTISRSYAAEPDDVWDACTNPERIRRWFLPISGDLREGGHFQLEGQAGGTILRCDAPRGFSATWEYGGEVSWIELRLTPDANGGTRFELEHTAAVGDTRWAEFGPGAVGVGWDLLMLGLGRYVETGTPPDPSEAAAWTMSADGKDFIRRSSEGWGDASIAGGTDPTSARAAAQRTTAFYTGEAAPPPEETSVKA
jgi:uncharacterized protein YndB with AHSA1/START domain